jgi:hypothetical protein
MRQALLSRRSLPKESSMSPAPSRAALALAALVLPLAVGAGVLVGEKAPVGSRPPLSEALGALPASTTSVGFTDWNAAVRAQRVIEAQRRDLLTRSVVRELSAETSLGLRETDIAWEAYAQGATRKALLVRLDRGRELDTRRLRMSGYVRKSGIWVAGRDHAAYGSIVGVVSWLPSRQLIVASTTPDNIQAVFDALQGRAPALASRKAVRAAAEQLGGSTSVLLQEGSDGCRATGAEVNDDASRQVKAAEDRFGTLATYRYLGRGLSDVPGHRSTQRFVVAMPFASARVASEQASVRGALSAGPFIGRFGPMEEVLTLRSARSDGSTAVLTYDHPADSELLMTGRGPLLPASC